jgi:hypothetical protein
MNTSVDLLTIQDILVDFSPQRSTCSNDGRIAFVPALIFLALKPRGLKEKKAFEVILVIIAPTEHACITFQLTDPKVDSTRVKYQTPSATILEAREDLLIRRVGARSEESQLYPGQDSSSRGRGRDLRQIYRVIVVILLLSRTKGSAWWIDFQGDIPAGSESQKLET